MVEINKIYNADCLGEKGMCLIPDKFVDMILTDLPYGITMNKWDTPLPLDALWGQFNRVIKDRGVIVLTSAQPFTSQLVMSNPGMFKYEIIWDKKQPTGFLNANKRVLRRHENILVFYRKQCTYNPQFTAGKPYTKRVKEGGTTNYNKYGSHTTINTTGNRYPTSILEISNADKRGVVHPTQKPISLFEWLIKTYTNPGDIVLDCCIGSGTTAIACLNTGRNFIGYEIDPEYYNKAMDRLSTLLEREGSTGV